jgi:CRP-like cAMP-binding protein
MPDIKVKLASSDAEKERIFQLRYEIYVEEMNRKQSFANHEKKLVYEPYDDTGSLFYAESDSGEIIGTVRINFRKDGPLECEELYEMENFAPFYPNQVSMSTKLMVKRNFRSSPVAGMLCMRIYEHARQNNVILDFIDTNPHLVRLYGQVGYRLYKKNIDHPDFGNVIPMVFLLDDMEYLKLINSPFIRVARRFSSGTESRLLFNEKFPRYKNIRPLFAVEARDLWKSLSKDISLPVNQGLTFLKDFSQEDSEKLLGMLDLINYEEGAIVFKESQESQGLFCILSGSVEVRVTRNGEPMTIAILNRGEVFGELGFITKQVRNATIVVRETSKLLILTPNEFQKLEVQAPALAVKLLKNVFEILTVRFQETTRLMLKYRNEYEEVIKKFPK